MPVAPRIALLVHNRFERDPRVSRHARAALGAGYRVAVLSVVAADDPRGGPARWAAPSDGALVFESRVLGRGALGRLRSLVARGRRLHADGTRREPRQLPALGSRPAAADAPLAARTVSPLAQAADDLFQIALLLWNNYGLFRQFRRVGAAVVHANDLNVLPAGYLLARYWRAPLVYDSHELWTELPAAWSPFLRRLFAVLEGALIRRSQAVVTVNAAIAAELARRYAGPRPIVVMNCAETGSVTPEPAPGQGAPAWTTGVPLPVIYQGMFHRHSGLLDLVAAAAQAPAITLGIRGWGELEEAVRDRIRTCALDGRVSVLDPVPMPRLIPALRGFAVGVVPYVPVGLNFRYASPNKLFEYMAAGLAVVCSDLPVLREVVEDAECGLLYEPGNVESLAGALRRLAADPDLAHRLGSNGRAAVRRRYNAAHEEAKLIDVYRRLLLKPRSGSSGA